MANEENLVRQGKADEAFNTAGDAISKGKTVEQIQVKYHTAVRVQQPRDLIQVENKCLIEAKLAGASCFYGWGSGKDRVEGPSIDCAMIAARNWGNLALEMAPIHETPQSWVMDAFVVDLETGFTYSRQFRQSKRWTVYGRMDVERKDDVRFQIGQSKCQRNAILRFVPKWLTDKMVETAKEGVREKIQAHINKKGIESARKAAADALSRYSIKPDDVEKKYGKKYGAWDVELLVVLQGDIAALTSGAESADNLFPKDEPEPAPEASGGGLSTDDMKPGDPATHQGYEPKAEPEPEKKSTKKDSPQTKADF